MNTNDAGGRCVSCGAPLATGVAACATCGKLVRAAPASAPTRRTADLLLGIIAGLAGGIVLVTALTVARPEVVKLCISAHALGAAFFVDIAVDALILGALLAVGIRCAARGRVLLGTSLIVAGIVAALPTLACNLVLYTMQTLR